MPAGGEPQRPDQGRPTLVYLYGPPAVGKLTVSERLSARTGWALFHNHLSVNAVRPVFTFGSTPFRDVLERFRLDIFRTAMAERVNLIFTNNSARAGFAAFAGATQMAVEDGGGRVQFVCLTAPLVVLEERVMNSSRQGLDKLLEVPRLREMLESFGDAALHDDDFRVDTSERSADQAALAIQAHIASLCGAPRRG